jgi:signal transduction histidine kinase
VGIFTLAIRMLKKTGGWLKKTGKSAGKKMNRVYTLLPVTWQWMLCGSALVLVIFLAAESRRAKWMLLSLLIGFGLILYGAHCFGLLLESTKRMSKGDLEEKVDDKLMTGSFKEFAGELNGLADVAVVAAQKQLKSERMKTELITNVSHDIKTPLTSIINYVDLLQKPHTEQEQEKYLEVLDRQSQRLKKLVEDLMEMSKASTGNLAVEIGRVDAAEAVNQALGEFSDKLDKAGLFPVFRQPDKAVYMMADGRLVWRVMSNLLSNAVKYALPGTRLYVDLQQLENKVLLSLKNISREELNVQADELLERFVRGDTSRNTEGSGLGLNIAKSLMELQKGQLQILVDGDLFKVTLIFPAAE